MSTLVFAYGAKPPVQGAEIVAEQISLAHKYYNRLVELHREQREVAEAVRCELCPELEAVEAAVSAADDAVTAMVDAIRRSNAAERRKRATPAEQADLAALKELRGAEWAERKAVRQRVAGDAEIQSALAAVYADFAAAKRRARADCFVFWGSYLEVEKAVEAAVGKSFGPPRFRRWTGDGLVAVQIQKGMTVAEATACEDTRLRIGAPTQRGKRAPLVTVSLRVGSEGRDPIWAQVPVYLHRPLPEDAIIMGAALIRRQVAVRRGKGGLWQPYYDWSVNFTIRTEASHPKATSGACGIDLGWRLMPDGSLRVAYIVGDDGRNEQLVLPAKLLDRWRKCEDLQSIRDGLFDQVRADMGRWLATAAVPEWLREATATMARWRGKGRLAQVLARWTGERFPGDALMLEVVARWQERDVHLWQFEQHNRIKAQRIRQHLYRRFAAEVRERYASIAVEDCDWRKLAALPPAEANDPVNALARYHQRIASVGMLRACLNAAGATMVNSQYTTSACCIHGGVDDWDRAADLEHTWETCGCARDQDENAALNLIARAKAVKAAEAANGSQLATPSADQANGAESPAREPVNGNGQQVALPVTIGNGRWQRRKAARSQKPTQAL